MANTRAQDEATATLHQLLDYRKSQMGIGAQERIEPEDFFPVNPKLILKEILQWDVQAVAMVGHEPTGEEMIAKCIKEERRILLRSGLSDAVARYTLAHELAHVRLHSANHPRSITMLDTSQRDRAVTPSDIEREAEVFARELLMPAKAVRLHFMRLFGISKMRAASDIAARFAPHAHEERPVDVRVTAREIAECHGSRATPSLVEFFGVSTKSMASRLMGLYLVY